MVGAVKRWRPWQRNLFGLLIAVGTLAFMLRWFEHSQVYHPDRSLRATGAELGRPFQEVWFRTDDGVELNGWFFPADTNSLQKGMTVLVCHGNGGNISYGLDLCHALLTTGVNVLTFDYRGYGKSRGRPSEAGTYQDAQTAYRWLRGRGFAAREILAYGESLGGGVASELALRAPLGGLVLQSSFSSIPDVGAELFPWLPARWLARIQYDTIHKLPRLRLPLLVMHSRADDLIGFHHGERNFAAANPPKLFCEIKGGHNDALSDPGVFMAGLEQFLRLVEAARTEAAAPGPL
jgi:uncharacterized protein